MNLFSIKNNARINYRLQANRVDLWHFSLLNYPDIALYLLDEQELKRAHQFHFERHRRRFIAAHAIVRLILAHYLQTVAAQIKYIHSAHGKPGIETAPNFHFNLSHSGDYGLLAVGQASLGVDIEHFALRPYQGIAQKMFSAEEYNALKKMPSTMIPLSFFSIWSQKEAFIKACGLGLAYPTQEFSVTPLPGECSAFDGLHQKLWHLHSYLAYPGYAAAVCVSPEVSLIRKIHLLNPNKLLAGVI